MYQDRRGIFNREPDSTKFVYTAKDHDFQVKPTRVLIHGFQVFGPSKRGNLFGEDDFKKTLVNKYLSMRNYNSVSVRWTVQTFGYNPAVNNVPIIAKQIAKFLDLKLKNNTVQWKNLKIVGHSLGAHIAGEKVLLSK